MDTTDMTPTEAFAEYLERNQLDYITAGSSSIYRLKALCELLGYGRDNTNLYDNAILNFLSENPDAIYDLIRYMSEMMDYREKWEEAIKKELEKP